jgi:hypothetical protein
MPRSARSVTPSWPGCRPDVPMSGRWLVTAYHFAFLAVLADFGGKRIGLASGTARSTPSPRSC